MTYDYLISYSANKGLSSLHGHINITRNKKIKSMDDVTSIKELIEHDYAVENVVILNIFLLSRKFKKFKG